MSSKIIPADMSRNMEGMESVCQMSRAYEARRVEVALIVSGKHNP